MPDTSHLTQCVACRHSIPKNASICSVCRSYQHAWQNWLQYLSGMAALLLLIASAITWLVGNARSYLWYRDDVRVMAANTHTGAVVWNRSDGDVFLSRLVFYMAGRTNDWIAPTLIFEEKLSTGQFARKDFPKAEGKKDRLFLVRGVSAIEFEADIVQAVNGDACYDLDFYENSDPSALELIQMAGPTLNKFPVNGYLQYWGINRSDPIKLPLLGFGVVYRCSNPK